MTSTSTVVPGAPAGVMQSSETSSTTTTVEEGTPPNVTVFVPASKSRNPVPEIEAMTPPWEAPESGVMSTIVGGEMV